MPSDPMSTATALASDPSVSEPGTVARMLARTPAFTLARSQPRLQPRLRADACRAHVALSGAGCCSATLTRVI